MWSSNGSIANWKKNLNRIALHVHDFDDDNEDDLSSFNGGDSDRVRSHSFGHSQIRSDSALPNGVGDSPFLSEDHMAQLDKENVSLKQVKISPNSPNLVKGSQEQGLNGQNKLATSVKNRTSGNQWQNGVALKMEGHRNGFAHGIQADPSSSCSNSIVNDKELEESEKMDEDGKIIEDLQQEVDYQKATIVNLERALQQSRASHEEESSQQLEAFTKEKEELVEKVAESEKTTTEWRNRVNKLEDDNTKLRRALELSMTGLNRMSVDSDFLVDRRIVIKLLVTYFQRNHSKEVLDLMVRMLGLSQEDKERIGGAQQGGGKGVVRGVLGLPGRLVGGIIGGGGSPGTPTNEASENQSFADLWVDFLLKESQERGKRDSIEANTINVDNNTSVPTTTSPLAERRKGVNGRPPIFSSVNPSIDTSRSSSYSYDSTRQYDDNTGGSEFSTVPLTPANRLA